jgi:hypothetical protein
MASDDPVNQARAAWASAMNAFVRAAKAHTRAARLHERLGAESLAAVERGRVAEELAGYEAAIARHPEWAIDAPPWPDLDLDGRGAS